MIDLKLTLSDIPYAKQRDIIDQLEELDDIDIDVISASLTTNINYTEIKFKTNDHLEESARKILHILRKYKIYKKQMPSYDSPCWNYQVRIDGKFSTLILSRKN